MADGGLVSITLPTGEAATVPQGDLDQALAAGAHLQTETEAGVDEKAVGGGLGQAASFALGAGRTASFGATDEYLPEIAGLLGGDSARKDMIRGLGAAKEVNPYSTMGGEAAGLFVGGGEGVMAVGEGAEQGLAGVMGKGLVGRTGAMAGRGAAEGSLLGYGQAVSEQALGDPQANAEKLFAEHIGTGALLGGAAGAGLGVLSHVGSEIFAPSPLLRATPGPTAHGALDAVAGVADAGSALRSEMRESQALVEQMRQAGATSEQAARLVDEINDIGRARTAAGPVSGAVDDMAARYAANRAGGNVALQDVLEKGYAARATRIAKQEDIYSQQALRFKSAGDSVLRDLEDTANEVQFQSKSDQMAKLVDSSRLDTQRDTLARALQDTDEALRFWEGTASKGGAEGAVKAMRKRYTDALDTLARIDERGGATASRDLFIRADEFKKALDSYAQWGKAYGLPEAIDAQQVGLRPLADKWRNILEDADVWGQAGNAQREWNQTFSEALARRQHFGDLFGQRIDQVRGIPVPDLNAEKILGQFKKFESDAAKLETVKTTQAAIDGWRARIAAIRKYGDLSEGQVAKLAKGEKSLDEFEKVFREADKEATVVSRLKQQQLEEQGKSLGGIIGLGADILTKPLTTMERLGAIKATTERFEKAVAGGLDKFFGGATGKAVMERLRPSTATVRPRAEVVKDIGRIRELAASPMQMQARVSKLVGDLAKHAPTTAAEVGTVAQRAINFLAMEAPRPSASRSVISGPHVDERYSDSQLTEWERKRAAALDPKSVLEDMQRGTLNRDAIRTVKFVSPKLYLEMQQAAQDKIRSLEAEGKLDKMPMAQQAQLAIFLGVPPNETWEPDYIAMMQALKADERRAAQQAPAAGPAPLAKRPIRFNEGLFQTEAQQVEARTNGKQ